MSWNIGFIFILLLSVLTTFSFPITTTLYKAIQDPATSICPLFQKVALTTTEPDYLKYCPYPIDFNSTELHIIRCSLYLTQFNLLCESDLPTIPQVFLSMEELERALLYNEGKSVLINTCNIFTQPLVKHNNTVIDKFFAEKCETFCANALTNKIEMICVAASYLRLIAIKTQENMQITKTIQENVNKTSQIAASDSILLDKHEVSDKGHFIPIVAQSGNEATQVLQVQEEHLERQVDNSGLTSVTSVGNTGPLTLSHMTLTEPGKENADISQDNDGISSNGNDNTAIVTSKQVAAESTATMEEPHNSISVNAKPESNEKTNNTKVAEEKTPEKSKTPPQPAVDVKSMTQPVKNDDPPAPNDIPQDYAVETDYPSGNKDIVIDSPENNRPLPEVLKRPDFTEKEDEDNLSHNLYKDDRTVEDDSYFFTYFMMLCVVFIFAYVGYHNKQKIIAIVVEGRRGSSGGGRGGRSRGGRRPNSANYQKLDSNLEEAVSSNTPSKNSSKVIY